MAHQTSPFGTTDIFKLKLNLYYRETSLF